ncbi:hypothetical protein NPX13_g5812 [Xylaria arbuscula]|uniref:Secreted protein n=1 Tax=Xylaria arbuscula TaxID=114810 RepID=A0A9W8NDS0_9PEZI|nr:hypothetical protein NPX13_g5812 [Xylaria arbuscula]
MSNLVITVIVSCALSVASRKVESAAGRHTACTARAIQGPATAIVPRRVYLHPAPVEDPNRNGTVHPAARDADNSAPVSGRRRLGDDSERPL